MAVLGQGWKKTSFLEKVSGFLGFKFFLDFLKGLIYEDRIQN